MIKWAPYPFVRIALAFITGILLALKYEDLNFQFTYIFLAAVCGFAMIFMLASSRRSAFLFSISGLVGLVCFTLAGWALTQIRTEKNDPQHLLHTQGNPTHYIGYLNDFLLEKPTIFQTTLRLQQVKVNGHWQPANGQIQLSFRKESGLKAPEYGNVLLIKGNPKLVAPPLNPNQFDYRKYLAIHNIYHQQFLYPGQFVVLGKQIDNPVTALSIQLRHNLDLIFRKLVPSHREYGIASALVLGIKDELDNEIKTTYSNTGTMHVLAVSGLHIGLVFSILSLGLKRLRSTVSHRLFSAAIVLAVVWGYAFITALSPSVLRAAVMFTFVVGAQVLQRRSNMYNTLATAAFALLCFNPYFLLDVGFQLSFLAVIAIVYLQPKIYKLLEFEGWLPDKIWALTCVSLAAQIGTFPLSLYYFHQFPVYFLLTNLIAVPLSTLILYVGFVVLLVSFIPVVNIWAGKLMQLLLYIMNEAMMWLEKWPYALINRIPLTGAEAVLLCFFLIMFLIFMARPKLKFLMIACAVLAFFSFSHLKQSFASVKQRKLIIFAVPKQAVWSFLDGKATVLADSAFIQNKQAISFNLEPTFVASGISNVNFQNWQESTIGNIVKQRMNGMQLIVWHGLKIAILEKPLKSDLVKPFEIDYLVLQRNAWISPEKLAHNFRFKKLIFDSSNESWYVRWLSKKLVAGQIPYHDVNTQGSFIVQR